MSAQQSGEQAPFPFPSREYAERLRAENRQKRELAWDDPLLEACESAPCPCGHIAFDHDWYGCDDELGTCDCKRSHIHALLTSGVVTVALAGGAS